MFIKRVVAKSIPDSRGELTIEVRVNDSIASSPSGKSKGAHETPSFHKSLNWNISFLNNFSFQEKINSFDDLKKIESAIRKKTGFKDVKKFGANALFAFESAILKALAKSQNKQLWQVAGSNKKIPVPVGNVIEGGLHAHAENHPSFQEFLIIPQGKSAKENFSLMKKIHSNFKKILHATKKTDEGAWEATKNEEQIFEIFSKLKEVKIGTDVAASSFYRKTAYSYKNKNLDKPAQIYFINSLIKKFNLLYVEDPLYEEDFEGFSKIHKDKNHMVVGDDLTATQISRLKKAISKKSINAMIIKPNQNGSLIELKEVFDICKKNKIKTIISHRSGETMDSALADYAVGFGADYIKCGISTKWREVKLKRLVEIDRFLTNKI